MDIYARNYLYANSKVLKQGYLVTAVSDNCGRNREEWAFATLSDMLQFIKKELSKKNAHATK